MCSSDLWVLLLTVLLQVGSWRAEASSNVSVTAAPLLALGEFDAPDEDSSEEPSAVDDAFDGMLAPYHPGCCPAPSHRFQRTELGLPAGSPPLDVPFKPPRA